MAVSTELAALTRKKIRTDRARREPVIDVQPTPITGDTLISRAQILDRKAPMDRIWQDVVEGDRIRRAMAPQLTGAVLDNGELVGVHRVEDTSSNTTTLLFVNGQGEPTPFYRTSQNGGNGHGEVLSNDLYRVRTGLVVPVGGWAGVGLESGGRSLMLAELAEDVHTYPDLLQGDGRNAEVHQGLLGQIVKDFHGDGRLAVVYGMCVDPAGINRQRSKSGQSLKRIHEQVNIDPLYQGRTFQTTRERRDEQAYDGGLSRSLGEGAIDKVSRFAFRFDPGARLAADNLGWMIELPSLDAERFGTKDFAKFWAQISGVMQGQMLDVHAAMYETPLPSIYDFVRGKVERGEALSETDTSRFNEFFAVKDLDRARLDSTLDDVTVQQLNSFAARGLGRYPAAWSGGIMFRPDRPDGQKGGAFAFFQYGLTPEINFGVDEGLVISLDRPSDAVPVGEMVRMRNEYEATSRNALAAVG